MQDLFSFRALTGFVTIAQSKRSHKSLSTHIACVYLSGTDPWRSLIQVSPSYMVSTSYFAPDPDNADRAGNMHTLDFLAFLVIVFLSKKSRGAGPKVPGILRIIVEDATRYFLVIFTSHFVLEMTLSLARVSTSVFVLLGLRSTSPYVYPTELDSTSSC